MQRLIERLSRLIALPSISSAVPAFDQSNAAMVTTLADWFGERGFTVETETLATAPDKLNLIATAGSGEDGLILSGHTDTVPCNAELWDSDPFELIERDGRFYGLGVADMKCFFPLILEALDGLDLKALEAPLTVLATADEESSMCGARRLTERAQLPGRYVVIGEPTGLTPVSRHKGVVWVSIGVEGRSGHASMPALGRNAIEGMHAVIGALLRWRDEVLEGQRDAGFSPQTPTLNFGTVNGGDNPNRICARCELQCDLRILPGRTGAEVIEELTAVAETALRGTEFSLSVTPLIEPIPALATDGASSIVRFAESLTGRPAQAVAFGTEGPFFNRIGKETVILGPGDIAQAHQPNEFVAGDRLAPMTGYLREMVRHFCMRGGRDA